MSEKNLLKRSNNSSRSIGGREKFKDARKVGLRMPNVDFPTFGGRKYWDIVEEKNSWKLQQNQYTKLYRVLDSQNIRRAWGFGDEMFQTFHRMTKKHQLLNSTSKNSTSINKLLKALQEEYREGKLTKKEFEKKKESIINK